MVDEKNGPGHHGQSLGRRTLLKGVLGAGIVLPIVENSVRAASEKTPEAERPQPGDQLVFFSGEREGEVIGAADVKPGEHLIIALPKDPISGVIRSGSRLNRVTLARVDPDKFKEPSKTHAAGDIVAFSAICTHGGCLVNLWRNNSLYCACHYSHFNPWDRGRVTGGPARRRLAALPITVKEDKLIVTDGFTGKVGIRK